MRDAQCIIDGLIDHKNIPHKWHEIQIPQAKTFRHDFTGVLRDCSGETPEIMRLQKQSGPESAALGCAPPRPRPRRFRCNTKYKSCATPRSLGFFLSPARTYIIIPHLSLFYESENPTTKLFPNTRNLCVFAAILDISWLPRLLPS